MKNVTLVDLLLKISKVLKSNEKKKLHDRYI